MGHTPGPWTRRDTPDYAEINAPGITQPIAIVAKAEDADLMSAAPELLAALERMIFNAVHGNGLEAHYQAKDYARAAIAKARGGDKSRAVSLYQEQARIAKGEDRS